MSAPTIAAAAERASAPRSTLDARRSASFATLLALAWKESRTARRRLLLYMSSIALGVAALVAIDSFSANVSESVRTQSRALLANDIDAAERALDRRWPWWRSLNAPRQRVLLNMCFNMGGPRLAGFVQALARMQEGDFGRAATAMLASKWATQVGDRAIRLSTMMRTGRDAA